MEFPIVLLVKLINKNVKIVPPNISLKLLMELVLLVLQTVIVVVVILFVLLVLLITIL